ncbi:hypothetical protein [Vulcanococcus limneticus]|uniref:hypothetical protein n=1 Tax=Vulcanococcus limneticus TaxID=2170428 RepID=UPI00398BE108
MIDITETYCEIILDDEFDRQDIAELLAPLAKRCCVILSRSRELETNVEDAWEYPCGLDVDHDSASEIVNIVSNAEGIVEWEELIPVLLEYINRVSVDNGKTHVLIGTPIEKQDTYCYATELISKFFFAHSTMPFFSISSCSYDCQSAWSDEQLGFRANGTIVLLTPSQVASELIRCQGIKA